MSPRYFMPGSMLKNKLAQLYVPFIAMYIVKFVS